MNWDQVEGQWKQVKGKLKEKWGKLTDDDLEVMASNRDKLVGKLQERYGLAKERAQTSIDEFISGLKLGVDDEPPPAPPRSGAQH
jgi:uncharacterized protein YjbJ (UPF0337 family)